MGLGAKMFSYYDQIIVFSCEKKNTSKNHFSWTSRCPWSCWHSEGWRPAGTGGPQYQKSIVPNTSKVLLPGRLQWSKSHSAVKLQQAGRGGNSLGLLAEAKIRIQEHPTKILAFPMAAEQDCSAVLPSPTTTSDFRLMTAGITDSRNASKKYDSKAGKMPQRKPTSSRQGATYPLTV